MGLVRAKAVRSTKKAEAVEQRSCEQLGAALEDADATVRRHAARQISSFPHASGALLNRLGREESTAVREAILTALLQLRDASIESGLSECLRSENAALRNDVIETFRQLGGQIAPFLRSLLTDSDPDVRIFAVNILNSEHYPDAERWLIDVIERDEHVNVCATAVDLLCELGTAAAIEPLLRLKARFAQEAYIQFAADLALKRIREI